MKLRILIRNSRRLIICFSLFLTFFLTGGQQFSVRTFDEEGMKVYAEQQAFDYMNYTVRPPSIWERISWWFQSMLREIFMNPNTPWLTRIAYYLIILIVLGAAVFYIIRLRYGGGITPDYKSHSSGVTSITQTSTEDFNQLIEGAIKEQNFKLAIRYVYLKTLSSLAKKGMISLKDWKSPYDYERELQGDIASSYQEMAMLFEYVWYGDFDAGEDEFKRGNDLSIKLESA